MGPPPVMGLSSPLMGEIFSPALLSSVLHVDATASVSLPSSEPVSSPTLVSSEQNWVGSVSEDRLPRVRIDPVVVEYECHDVGQRDRRDGERLLHRGLLAHQGPGDRAQALQRRVQPGPVLAE